MLILLGPARMHRASPPQAIRLPVCGRIASGSWLREHKSLADFAQGDAFWRFTQRRLKALDRR
jgi:hypothetical protein